MGKYLLLWKFDRTKTQVDPKVCGVEFNMLMKVIKTARTPIALAKSFTVLDWHKLREALQQPGI